MNKIINNKQIEDLKNNNELFSDLVNNQKDNLIVYTLKNLGKLENESILDSLLYLMNNDNSKIRVLSIKNLAKLQNISLLKLFIEHGKQDISSDVRREAVSAIGRLRREETIPILIEFLSDKDPKIVMQAIRGLLVFSKKSLVKKELKKLIVHPNELIKEVISKEFSKTNKDAICLNENKEYFSFLKNLIVNGDIKQILENISRDSIHLTFTSPPYYNARDYSIYQSYNEYLSFLEKVFKEVHRITKEGRFLILNTSPIIIPRISRTHSSKRYPIPYDIHGKLINIGWEFIDDIIWVKPEASVKNRNAGFLQHRKPLAYKPNAITEHLIVYRKKTDKLIDWNIRQYSKEEVEKSKVNEKYETTNVWHIDPTFDKVHSAVFPLELCDRIIKYYSFVGDLVFDPFAGSGTLGRSALKLKRNFFLTEIQKEYFERMKQIFHKNDIDLFTDTNKVRFMEFDEFITKNKKKNL